MPISSATLFQNGFVAFNMEKVFQKVLDNNFSDLAGLAAEVSVPVPEYLVNELIEAALAQNKSITSCQIIIGAQNQVLVNLKTSLWPWPIRLKLRLEKQADFTGAPKIKAWLENQVLLANFGSLFSLLPVGVNIQGNQVSVNVDAFLTTPESKRILKLIKSLEIKTEQGLAIFVIKAGIGTNKI